MALRLFGLAPVGGIATVNQRDFDRLPGIYVPGQRMVDRRRPELPHTITIDSLGYRGIEEFPRRKPAGEIRVLMLGDSFTYGDLVDDSLTFPVQLERSLRGECGPGVRVINAGIGGTTIDAASELARRSAPLEIDVAVLTFTENDVTDLAVPMWEQMGANRAAKSRFPMSVVYPLVRQSAIWNLAQGVRGKWRNLQTDRVIPSGSRNGPEESDSSLLALRTIYELRLAALRDSLAARGIPLLLVIYPSHLTIYRMRSEEQVAWVNHAGKEAGLTTVDLLPALRQDGRPVEELFFLPTDGHPRPEGYAIATRELRLVLERLPPLASRCAAQGTPRGAAMSRHDGPQP